MTRDVVWKVATHSRMVRSHGRGAQKIVQCQGGGFPLCWVRSQAKNKQPWYDPLGIKNIYKRPPTWHSQLTSYLRVKIRDRKVWPFLPLTYSIEMEVLAGTVRQENEIKGFRLPRKKQNYLYLYVENPVGIC